MTKLGPILSGLSLLIVGMLRMFGARRRNRHYSRHELVVRWPRHLHGRRA
jgi:hypothetical protein